MQLKLLRDCFDAMDERREREGEADGKFKQAFYFNFLGEAK